MQQQNQIVPIHVNGDTKTVSARELHQFLGLAESQWKRWYTSNIINNPFATEGEDYRVLDMMSKTSGGRPTQDFEITIRFAKKISMATNTEKGEIAKNYFLKMEEIAQGISPETNLEAKIAAGIEKYLQSFVVQSGINPVLYFTHKVAQIKIEGNCPVNDQELAALFYVQKKASAFCKNIRMCGVSFEKKGSQFYHNPQDVQELLKEYIENKSFKELL